MQKQRSTGDLVHRFAFDERAFIDRGDGVEVDDWQERFSTAAGVIHLRGGEAVQAARLAGQHTQVIFVRAFAQTKAVRTDWRCRDLRSGAIFNIREIVPTDDRQWLDLTCQSGVNPG